MALVLWLAPSLLTAALALAAHDLSPTRAPGEMVAKLIIASVALTAVLYDLRHGATIPTRVKQAVALLLSCAALVAHFQQPAGGYPAGFHVPALYHDYIGAKYFPELRYDGLYDCTTLAQDEAGRVNVPTGFIDLRTELSAADFYVRDLRSFTLLPASHVLKRDAPCRARFSTERWQQFKDDVLLFRAEVRWEVWKAMQTDRGFSASPFRVAVAQPLTAANATPSRLAWLGRIDWLYLFGTATALWWAFGWRSVALATIFFGTQSFATTRMIGGAFMSFDWLFFFVLSICLARKHRPAWSGAALAVSTALRLFPGVVGLGVLIATVPAALRSSHVRQQVVRFASGGLATLVVCATIGALATSVSAYPEHVRTIVQLAKHPVSNHVGAPVVIGWHLLVLIPLAAALVFVLFRMRRNARALSQSLSLGSLFLMLLPLLSHAGLYLIGFVPLARQKRVLEALVLTVAFGSTAASMIFWSYDDRFLALSWITLLTGFGVLLTMRISDRGRAREPLRGNVFQPQSKAGTGRT